ncbi:hypothetical protein GCM10027589_05170 [Actinocorallia lasiicapitis]
MVLVIYTASLNECRSFYTSLGLTFTTEQHGTGPIHYAAELPHLLLELYPPRNGRTTGPLRLELHLPTPTTTPPTRRVLQDPDGRTIVLTT